MNKPFFSIIVVALNAKDYIKSTIDSVLVQDFSDYEIVVKDGLSSDGTVACIPKSEKINIYEEKDTGIYDAMNQAIGYAKGEYLCFLNCGDCLANPGVLKDIYELAKGRDNAIVYGNYSRKGVKCKLPSQITPFYLYRTPLCHQSMFFNRTLFDGKPYNTSYRILADYDHTLYNFNNKTEFVYADTVVCDYMGGGVSESEKGIQLKRQEYKEIRKKYFSPKEIRKYEFKLKLSMKGLRQKMASDKAPLFVRKLYRFLVNKVNG